MKRNDERKEKKREEKKEDDGKKLCRRCLQAINEKSAKFNTKIKP